MQRFLSAFLLFGLVACANNANQSTAQTDSLVRPASLPADSVERDAVFSFLDGCMESVKFTLGDQKAYAFCKCLYQQVKAKNPSMDSTMFTQILADTAERNRMAANCR